MSVAKIIQTILQLNSMHVKLLKIAETKQDIVIRDKVNDLAELTAQEKSCMKEIVLLETAWWQLIEEEGRRLGLQFDASSTLSDLIQALPDESLREELSAARNQLYATLQELKRKNEVNRQLIEQSLQYINLNIDILTDAPDQDVLYQKPTDPLQAKKRTGLFDRKA